MSGLCLLVNIWVFDFLCFAVPALIQIRWHGIKWKYAIKRTSISVSRAATTMFDALVAFMQWRITFVSASSCLASRLPMSRVGSEASTCFSSLKPPATTMHLLAGALKISCCERKRARSALFSSWVMKFSHFVGRDTSLHSIGRLIASKPLLRHFRVPHLIECSL